ncbi:MAG: DUF4124 domain-containing protein [Betaproteobacteria bacterium]|nr:DUF4124 domain-containing protein [Betaproteobacteria bacterium]
MSHSILHRGLASHRGAVALQMLALALLAGAAHAEGTRLYEWRDANGRMTYSQTPPTGAAGHITVTEVDTRQFTPAQKLAIRLQLGSEDAAIQADAQRLRQQVAASDRQIAHDLQALTRAEQAFKRGRTPLPGERMHNAHGGSRLLASYFERQRKLEAAVAAARQKLDEAYRERDQLQP